MQRRTQNLTMEQKCLDGATLLYAVLALRNLYFHDFTDVVAFSITSGVFAAVNGDLNLRRLSAVTDWATKLPSTAMNFFQPKSREVEQPDSPRPTRKMA